MKGTVRKADLIETLPRARRGMVKNHKRTFMELYNQGLNDTEISEALGFDPSTISVFRRSLELPTNIRKVADYKSRFMELHGEGLSDGEIGKPLGFSRQAIGDFRRSLGLPVNFKFGGKPSLDDGEKQRIRELHSKGQPISMIAEEIGRADITVYKFCKGEMLDTSMARGKGYVKRRYGEVLVSYLEEHGPTPQAALSAELEIPEGRFSRMAREMFDQVERFAIYGDLNINKMGNVFALRYDPRIIDFVAEGINFKVETPQDARTLVQHLKKQLGTPRAKDVVRRLGYVYQEDKRGTRARARASSFKATCPTCNGPLERRTFIDTWDPDGEPCDVSQDLWCPACRLRWMDLKDEPEEASG